MRTRKNISVRASLTRIAGTSALAALLLLAACQNEIPIQRPGGDCGMDPQPACVTISVGTKPAEEKTVAYGITTPATDAGTRTDDAIRADATTRTDLTGKWQLNDQITVSLQYYSDTEGTNPKNLLHTDKQTLTYKHIEGETAPAGNSPRFWTPDPELLPLPPGARSIRVTYRYRGSQAMTNETETGSTSGDATIVKDPEYTYTLVLGNELMTGHLEASNDPTARAGIASITAPDDATQDGCTSLVVISDPTAAIELPAPRWHRLTTQVCLTGMTPGQIVHLETGTMASDDSDGSSYTPDLASSITLTAPEASEAPDASPASPDSYNARIYFEPAATTEAKPKSVLTLYDGAITGSLNSPTPPRYFRIDCEPGYCYSFLAFALNLGNGAADAQVVDGTDADACLALLTRENPVWVVSGGGDGQTSGDAAKDKQVLENVRKALDVMRKPDSSVPNDAKGTIDLVLIGVKSLPMYKDYIDNERGAFEGYSQLRSISAPEVTSIEEFTFANCEALTTISLPQVTGSIKKAAFIGCEALTTVSLPQVTNGIGELAFYNCEALTTVSLPQVKDNIGVQAFAGCTALTTISLPEAKSIDGSAFLNCRALTTVSLPKAITIKGSAFNGCSALTTVSLPEAVTIDESAFQSCSALTTVSLPNATTIKDQAFWGCTALATVSLPEATAIGAKAFNYCFALTTLSLPKAITIGHEAFSDCIALTTLDLPAVTKNNQLSTSGIASQAFYNCSALTTLRLTAEGRIVMESTAFSSFGSTEYGTEGTKNCILYLHPDKRDSGGESGPQVNITTDENGVTTYTWANCIWKEIIFDPPTLPD